MQYTTAVPVAIGPDTLELAAWSDSPVTDQELSGLGDRKATPPRPWALAGLALDRGYGTPNHDEGWRDRAGTDVRTCRAQLGRVPRSRQQRQSFGDYSIVLGQEVLGDWRGSEGPWPATLDRHLSDAVLAPLRVNTVRVDRIDVAIDILADAEMPEPLLTCLASRCRVDGYAVDAEGELVRVPGEQYNASLPGVGLLGTGFVAGLSPMIRVYRKDVQLRRKHPARRVWYDRKYDQLAAALGNAGPAAGRAQWWRVEFELRGDVLTDYQVRDWFQMPKLADVLRQLATRTRLLERPKLEGERSDRVPLHPLWRAVVGALEEGDLATKRPRVPAVLAGAAQARAKFLRARLEWEAYQPVLGQLAVANLEAAPERAQEFLEAAQLPDVDQVALEAAIARKRAYYGLAPVVAAGPAPEAVEAPEEVADYDD